MVEAMDNLRLSLSPIVQQVHAGTERLLAVFLAKLR